MFRRWRSGGITFRLGNKVLKYVRLVSVQCRGRRHPKVPEQARELRFAHYDAVDNAFLSGMFIRARHRAHQTGLDRLTGSEGRILAIGCISTYHWGWNRVLSVWHSTRRGHNGG